MNKEEAYKKMSELMKVEQNAWQEAYGKSLGCNIEDYPKELTKKYQTAKINVEQFACELAATPGFSKFIISWMIDIEGSSTEAGGDDLIETLKSLDLRNLMQKCGAIPDIIQEFIESKGFKITDRGGGYTSWHIGVPCTNDDADILCGFLFGRFGELIERGTIKVKKKFWRHKLRGLYNWDELKTYLEEHKE